MARELVAGRLRVPGSGGNEPIYVVDGARAVRVNSLPLNSIENIRFMNAAEAASAYGADAARGGAILVTMIHNEGWDRVIEASHRQRLSKLGHSAGTDRFRERPDDERQVGRLRAVPQCTSPCCV